MDTELNYDLERMKKALRSGIVQIDMTESREERREMLNHLLEDFKNIEEDLIPGIIGAEVMEDCDNETS